MIEILEQGVKPQDVFYIHTCTNCNTKFKFQRCDCESGITDHMIYIYCPTCKYGKGVVNMNEFEQVR